MRLRTTGSSTVEDGVSPGLHVRPSIPFVRADPSRSTGAGAKLHLRAGPFQLAEDGVLMGQQISEETITVAVVGRQAAFRPGTENARREVGRQC